MYLYPETYQDKLSYLGGVHSLWMSKKGAFIQNMNEVFVQGKHLHHQY